MAELEGKTAIITGATRGIGLAIAKKLLANGASVIITGRNENAGKAAERDLAAQGGKVCFVAADQGSNADWQKVSAAAQDKFGRIDILVSNAGVSYAIPAAEMSLSDFRKLANSNLKGAFLGLQHVTAAIRRHKQGGAVVLMSSIVGKVGVPGYTHYSAAKGGLRLMAKAAALELGPEKIRVNSIHPGMIATDMTAAFDEKAMAPLIPLGKFGKPEDIANAALYLASPRGQFITGIELVVDGGWTVQ